MYRKKTKLNDLHSDGLDEIDEIELRNTILYHKHEYKRKLELGKAVHKIVINDEVDEDELLPEHKEALDLYLKKSVETFPDNIEFKPWQLSILEEVEIPTKRKIIWVVGKSCGEGKTWLQNYIEYKYGDRRVVSGITHALTKHPLITTDIFLCNFTKSVNTLTEINYDMLEGFL